MSKNMICFVFKQKMAYGLRISDLSSDVCSSDLTGRISRFLDVTKAVSELAKGGPVHSQADGVVKILHSDLTTIHLVTLLEALPVQETIEAISRSEERRVGNECVSTGRSRWPPYNYKQKDN